MSFPRLLFLLNLKAAFKCEWVFGRICMEGSCQRGQNKQPKHWSGGASSVRSLCNIHVLWFVDVF